MKQCLSYFFLFIVCAHHVCTAQNTGSYSINIQNGLPSNHIYYMIEDALGYLWLGTENGVVKYNGYDCKVFNLSNGLPTADVWELTEDAKGKIWLGDISHELGYIYKDEYHKAIAKKGYNSFYPKGLSRYKDGIIFKNTYNNSLNVVRNDSLKNFDKKFKYISSFIFGNKGEIYLINKYSFYIATIEGNDIVAHNIFPIDSSIYIETTQGEKTFINQNILFHYKVKSDFFSTLNIKTGYYDTFKTSTYLNSNYPIYLIQVPHLGNQDNASVNVITGKNILQFKDDSTLDFQNAYLIRSLVTDSNVTGSNVISFLTDALWGICLATDNTGLYVNYDSKNTFKYNNLLNLKNYKYVGKTLQNTSYWWDNSRTTLVEVKNNNVIFKQKFDKINKIITIVPYNADSSIIFSEGSTINCTHWFIHGKGIMASTDQFGISNQSAIVYKPRDVFFVSKIGGFQRIFFEANRTIIKRFDLDRYLGLAYDSIRKDFWAYNNDKIFIHFHNGKDSIISSEYLGKFGIKHIEKMVFDNTYGNIFFKNYDKIIMYNYEKAVYTVLFSNYNFNDAKMDIYNNSLVIAGRFGILFSKIKGLQEISEPVVYTNVKNNYYNHVSDMQLVNDKALLNTDKGVYNVAVPPDSLLIYNKPEIYSNKYRLILTYKDTVINIVSGDTISISQKNPLLEFDFINPFGNGKIKYSYSLAPGDSQWHEMNENVLNLPHLLNDTYTELSIIAYDDVFRSNKTDITLYIIPYWWQTNAGKTMIIFAIILLLSLFILVTWKLVHKTAEKRNLRMEMELTSIYAQINPHFIFNTLNSALLMVSKNKMDEAYTHISKFSKLLLAYLRSSRNKLITINDEVTNLKNYLELQQVRFKDKFQFEICVDNSIDAKHASIPSLLVQPFVENAINHGLLHKENNGHLKIEFRRGITENSLICVIADNGIGRKRSKLLKDDKTKDGSYGDDLIKGLVRIFNKYEKMNIEIKYTDIEDQGTGTIVEIFINKMAYGR